MGRVFLVHWNEAEANEKARELECWGWSVQAEYANGVRAVRRIREEPPDVVVISLARLPSHGRKTVDALRRTQTTGSIPIVFVDGEPEKEAEVRMRLGGAAFTTWEGLRGTLAALQDARG